MRDKRFIAVHRGGSLTKGKHRRLMRWARDCANHVLSLFGDPIDQRLINALKTAQKWQKGNASVGEARKASLDAIAVARKSRDPASVSVARCVGHAAATSHMADHSPGAADYALKAVKFSAKSVEREREWQDAHLPAGIKKLVLSARKKRHLKIYLKECL